MTNRPRRLPTLDTSIPLMVGREPEQAHVREALAAAIAGQGRVLLIGGEAGIGKTTLVEDLALHAREQHALVLTGRCFDQSVTPPYGPWVEIARRYQPSGDLPPFPTFLDDAQALAALGSQEHLFAAVTAFFIALAARQPLVLVLDDLHWADQGSLDLLRYLAREASEHRLLVLLTYRSDEVTRRHPLSQLVPLLVREAHAERLTLAPLDPDAVTTLVATRYPMAAADQVRLATWLAQRSAGHPLYLHELLRSLEEGHVLARHDDAWVVGDLGHVRVPSLVQGVIEARLARLGDDARAVLEIAAVIGQETSIDLWVAISGVPDALLADAVERATAAHIVEEVRDGAGFRFTHALIRETLYEGIGSLRRRALHRQIGAVLACRPNPEPDAIATHFQQAADARAVPWLVLAGERAQQAYAWNTAVERYDAALTMLTAGDGDPGERGWLQYRIGRLERFRRPEEAIGHLDEALRLAAETDDHALAAATRYSQGLCRFYTGDLVTAIEDLAVGADLLEALPLEEQERLGLGVDAHGVPAITTPRGFLVLVLSTVGRLAEALRMGEAMREGEPAPSSLGELWLGALWGSLMGLGEAYALLGRVEEARDCAPTRSKHLSRQRPLPDAGSVDQIQLQLLSIPYGTEHLAEHERLAAEAEAARTPRGRHDRRWRTPA